MRTNYRKIWEETYGPIPKDFDGRPYEIHHIDGNHSNNDPCNLKAVTKQEHYDIHFAQGDWEACQTILHHLNLTPDEISKRATEFNLLRVKQGTHPFLKRDDGSSVGRDTSVKRIKNGTHPFMRKLDGTSLATERVKNGTHPFLGGKLQRDKQNRDISAGIHNFVTNHPNKIIVTCPHCGISGGKPNMMRNHFDRCKFKT